MTRRPASLDYSSRRRERYLSGLDQRHTRHCVPSTSDPVLSNTADSTSEAVRWLRRSYRAGALVDAVAAVGMAMPRLYGPTLQFDAGFDRHGPEFSYAIRAGAPLMAGWTVLLMWADRRPLERRGVLPITIVPVIAGLVANDTHAVRAGQLFGRGVAPVRALQLALVGLFAYSAVKARAALRVGSESEPTAHPILPG